MSLGNRSGVNWMRFCVPCTVLAIAFANIVLPVPGTSSSRRCPSDSNAVNAKPDRVGLAHDRPLDVADQLVERLRKPLCLFRCH